MTPDVLADLRDGIWTIGEVAMFLTCALVMLGLAVQLLRLRRATDRS
jgi:hypothetical protein